MAIVFHCTCGHLMRAQESAAGKRTRCPGCNQVLSIPGTAKPAASVAGVAPAPAPAAVAADPFAPELDWTSLESPDLAEHDPRRPKSGAIKIDSVSADTPAAEIARPDDGSRQYRILTQKDQGFAGKFNASKLEELLNDHARRGWSLKVAVTMHVPSSHGGHHDELVVILER